MEFFETVERRRSIRGFVRDRAVEPEQLRRVLDAARRAPSAGNRQPWRFLIVREAVTREALAVAAHDQMFLLDAPLVIVVCAEPERSAERYGARGRNLYCLQDTAAAVTHLLLAATALGLGSCWVGAFDEDEVVGILRLPRDLRPVALIPLGYAAEDPAPTSRREHDEVVTEG